MSEQDSTSPAESGGIDPRDYDNPPPASAPAPEHGGASDDWSRAVEALTAADTFPFLSNDYLDQSRVAAAAFEAAARPLAGNDDARAAQAEEISAKLELFLAQPWPDDPSQVETRDFAPASQETHDAVEAPREFRSEYPSGITSYVSWTFVDDSFRVTGQDFKSGGGEYEYIATIKRRDLPVLADALGTDVAGIEAAWADQIDHINNPGFVTWLKAKNVAFEFFAWHDFDWQ